MFTTNPILGIASTAAHCLYFTSRNIASKGRERRGGGESSSSSSRRL